ncbi:hypothetical protein [Acetobacterium wieringae]|nr:hypothetical protein [Acetobacterium wieringae]
MRKRVQKLSVLLLALLLIVGLIPASVSAATNPSVNYRTHVQNEGWQDWKKDGTMSGTSGKGFRLEGIEAKLDTQGYDLGINYQTHIQNIGWEADTERGWKSNGTMSGTEGLSYRLEAIQIILTGSDAAKFDIYYQVHAQNMGWLGWAKNGESAGTAGFGYRLEGIRIAIVAAGSAAPVGTIDREDPFYENSAAPFAAILQEYKIAEDSGYAADTVWNLPNVNKELASSSYKKKLYYMVEDISGDAIPELVISMYDPRYQSIVHPNGFQIYDMYRLNNGIPERIFDIRTMGYRAIYTICENNIIRCYGSGGVNSHNEKFYLLNGSNASTILTITFDKPYYTLNDAKNLNRMITKDEADKIINSYKQKTDINWIAF